MANAGPVGVAGLASPTSLTGAGQQFMTTDNYALLAAGLENVARHCHALDML